MTQKIPKKKKKQKENKIGRGPIDVREEVKKSIPKNQVQFIKKIGEICREK